MVLRVSDVLSIKRREPGIILTCRDGREHIPAVLEACKTVLISQNHRIIEDGKDL